MSRSSCTPSSSSEWFVSPKSAVMACLAFFAHFSPALSAIAKSGSVTSSPEEEGQVRVSVGRL